MSGGKAVSLKVAEAMQSDVTLGRARINTAMRMALGVDVGDIVELIGKRSTSARVFRTLQEDEDKLIVRIDGLTRKNAGVSMGDKIEVVKTEAKPAEKIILAPVIENEYKIRLGHGTEQFMKRGLLRRPVTQGDAVVIPGIALMSGYLPFYVIKTVPRGIVQITETTDLVIKDEPVKESEIRRPHITYEDIGGLKEEVQRVREMIEFPLKHPELFERLGIDPPKGVLLHGPPGTGKTLIAKAVANEAGANFFSIQGPEIMSKYYGQSEERLRERFNEAEQNPPSVLFIDELDSIAPKRDEVQGEVERRVVAQLLTLMDGLSSRGNLIVIAATNRVDAIDPALRRPGRFDREIEIGVPDRVGRKEILQIHTRGMPIEDGDADIKEALTDELANLTHGFVGADLAALCREAAMKALRRYIPEMDLEKPVPPEVLDRMKVTKEDFKGALKEIEPSSLREVFVEIPKVAWEDIGGLNEVKKALKEVVELPITDPAEFVRVGIKPIKGVLLYGPPGTGKTLIAKAIANESHANFITIKGPEIISKWVGESEKAIRQIFKKAKQAAPSIVFLDEIDAIAVRRGSMSDSGVTERVVNQILTSMDGLESLEGVVVIGATNRADLIDSALLRPGRFDRVIFVPPPDEKERLAILQIHTRSMPLASDVPLNELARKMDGYVGADILGVCREAGLSAIRSKSEKVARSDFDSAMKAVPPSIDTETIKYYENMSKQLSKASAVKERGKLAYFR